MLLLLEGELPALPPCASLEASGAHVLAAHLARAQNFAVQFENLPLRPQEVASLLLGHGGCVAFSGTPAIRAAFALAEGGKKRSERQNFENCTNIFAR